MDFHDKMCILVESEDEARQLCELLAEAGIAWVLGTPADEFVTFKAPAVYYCFEQTDTLHIWWHHAVGEPRWEIEQYVKEGKLEHPVRFCDLFHTRVSIPTVDDLL